MIPTLVCELWMKEWFPLSGVACFYLLLLNLTWLILLVLVRLTKRVWSLSNITAHEKLRCEFRPYNSNDSNNKTLMFCWRKVILLHNWAHEKTYWLATVIKSFSLAVQRTTIEFKSFCLFQPTDCSCLHMIVLQIDRTRHCDCLTVYWQIFRYFQLGGQLRLLFTPPWTSVYTILVVQHWQNYRLSNYSR